MKFVVPLAFIVVIIGFFCLLVFNWPSQRPAPAPIAPCPAPQFIHGHNCIYPSQPPVKPVVSL